MRHFDLMSAEVDHLKENYRFGCLAEIGNLVPPNSEPNVGPPARPPGHALKDERHGSNNGTVGCNCDCNRVDLGSRR